MDHICGYLYLKFSPDETCVKDMEILGRRVERGAWSPGGGADQFQLRKWVDKEEPAKRPDSWAR